MNALNLSTLSTSDLRTVLALATGEPAPARFATRAAAEKRVTAALVALAPRTVVSDTVGGFRVEEPAPAPVVVAAAKRGGKRGGAKAAAVAAGVVRSGSIRDLTERFNALVPEANALGIAWARVHRSLFETAPLAARVFAKLEDAIRDARQAATTAAVSA